MNDIKIKLSKIKIGILTLGSFGFVALGIWLWTTLNTQTLFYQIFYGLVCILDLGFFGLCGVCGLVKFFDNKPGLVINDEGILDNSGAMSSHLIKWTDIYDFNIGQVQSTRFILIYVNNPQDYIYLANKFKRFWMKMNNRIYGTPLSISTNSLQCNIEYLIDTIEKKIKKQSAPN